MAVELAKVSLWLVTMQKNKPFTFLDHALKCGDSLLGVSSVQQIENFSLRPGDRQVTFATANLFRYVDEASAKRRALEDLPSNDHTQIETKNRLHAEAEAATAKVKAVADCLIAFELRGLDGDAYEDQRTEEAEKVQLLMKRDADASLNSPTPTTNQLSAYAREQLRGRRTFHWPVEFPEVFVRGGFDAIVGNPPFLWGSRISVRLGYDYRDWLQLIHPEAQGHADLCAHFFRRAFHILTTPGTLGLIATNSISQTDTLRTGLIPIVQSGGRIYRARRDDSWPGSAGVRIALVYVIRGRFDGMVSLDGAEVRTIRADLTAGEEFISPLQLFANSDMAFKGVDFGGVGFILDDTALADIQKKAPDELRFIWPLLNAINVTSNPKQEPPRKIINFTGLPLSAVQHDAPHLLSIVETKVKPERSRAKAAVHREKWWHYFWPRPELYSAIGTLEHVIANPVVAKWITFSILPSHTIFTNALNVFPTSNWSLFGILQSTIHIDWALKYCSTMKQDPRYNPSDCFETFPLPEAWEHHSTLTDLGQSYHRTRLSMMAQSNIGLTLVYNRFHDRGEKSEDIARLRALHEEMDQAVAAAYGWSDLDLGHGFHATKQGERYTLSEPARRTVLDRLLALNHQRYAEEVAAGLHEKKKAKSKASKKNAAQGQLL
jgi:hypothetical protein